LQSQWRQTKDSWSIISVLPFGPLVQNNIAMQVQFWPDKKNLVGFQVERLLKQNKKSIDLSRTSVALRGLSASEYILFDQAVNLSKAEDKAKYCSLLASIGEYQVALSRATSTQWQTYLSDEFSAFDASSQKAELLRAQVSALEVQHKKLALVLGKKIPQPYQAEHWRSNYSLESLHLATQTHQLNWQTFWMAEIQTKQPQLASKVNQVFASTQASYFTLTRPLALALTTQAGLEELKKLADNFKQLQLLFSKNVAAAVGVQIGFNSNDGD
jgi:predicted lipoprotein